MYLITKSFHFEAAHRLKDWPTDHQCHRLHGHSYKIIVVITGQELSSPPKGDVLLDYGDISKIVKKHVVDVYDHQYLNDILEINNVTAEFLAKHIYHILEPMIPGLYYVEVKETENSSALYTPGVLP